MTAAVIALGAIIWLVLLLFCLALVRAAALGDLLAAKRERTIAERLSPPPVFRKRSRYKKQARYAQLDTADLAQALLELQEGES